MSAGISIKYSRDDAHITNPNLLKTPATGPEGATIEIQYVTWVMSGGVWVKKVPSGALAAAAK